VHLKCDGTSAKTRFGLSVKRTSPFKSARASVQSIAGSRGVCISGSNAGYTKFRGSVKRCEGDWLPIPFASFPFTSPPVRHRVPSRFNWTLLSDGLVSHLRVGQAMNSDEEKEMEHTELWGWTLLLVATWNVTESIL